MTVSMLYYAFCWHQTDLQSSFIIHGHRLSASQSTKWQAVPSENKREEEGKSQLNIPEGLTHRLHSQSNTKSEIRSESLTK